MGPPAGRAESRYGSHRCPQCGGRGSYRDEMGVRCVMCGCPLPREEITEGEAAEFSGEEEPEDRREA